MNKDKENAEVSLIFFSIEYLSEFGFNLDFLMLKATNKFQNIPR